MSASGRPARWIEGVLAIVIGALALLAGLGLVTMPEDDAANAAAPSTTAETEARLGPDPRDKRSLIVFMQPVATSADIDAVRRSLEGMTDLGSIRFVDRVEAYEDMKALYARTPEVIQSVLLEDVPVSFHVLPRPDVDRHVIGARLTGHQRVQTIVYPGE